jgi:hypothetical protein
MMFMSIVGRRTNLHAVWDSGILGAMHISDERAYALELAHSISPAEGEKWRSGTPADWADDSYGVANNLIYGVWPHDPGELPASYEQKGIYVVQVHLEKAGARLAAVLNQTLPSEGNENDRPDNVGHRPYRNSRECLQQCGRPTGARSSRAASRGSCSCPSNSRSSASLYRHLCG